MEQTTQTTTRTSAAVSLAVGAFVLAGIGWAVLSGLSIKNKTQTALVNGNISTNTPVSSQAWLNTNPGGGGAFTAIGAGPSGTIIATSDLSGGYRSLDRGQTWDVIGSSRGLETTHASAVAFDPADSQKIYLGTEAGLYLSTNNGQTFQRQPSGSPLRTGYIGSVAVAPTHTIVYVGRHSDWNTTDGQVYKSLDGGSSWTQVSTNLPATKFRILKLAVGPTDNLVYAISGGDTLVNGLPAEHVPSNVLYQSTDGGVNWAKLAVELGDVIVDFALDPIDPDILYLATQPSGAVYKSTDGGTTWSQKTTHTGFLMVKRDQPQVIRSINVEGWPGNPDVGIWRSDDGGDNWFSESPASNWDGGWQVSVPQSDPVLRGIQRSHGKNVYGYAKSLGLDASNADVLFLVNAQFAHAFGGVTFGSAFKNLYTNPVAAGWRGRSLDNVAVMDLAVTEADPQRVYAGSYDIGLWRSTDGGESWQTANSLSHTGSWQGYGGNTTTIVADPARANVVWASMAQESYGDFILVRSQDGGSPPSWAAGTGLVKEVDGSGNGIPKFINGLSVDRTSTQNNRTLFVTSTGDVYRSQNDGVTWSKVFDCNLCRTTAVDPNSGQVVYAGGEGGFFRSLDSGNTWSANLSSTLAGSAAAGDLDTFQWTGVHEIVPDRFTAQKVYAVAYGKGANKGLYVSADQGTNWTLLRTCKYCRGFTVDRFDGQKLYLTSSYATRNGHWRVEAEGVLRSLDGGVTWTAFNEGLAWTFGWPIVVKPAASPSPQTNPDLNYHLFMGSPGTGFFVRDITSTSGGGGGGGGPSWCGFRFSRNPCPLETE